MDIHQSSEIFQVCLASLDEGFQVYGRFRLVLIGKSEQKIVKEIQNPSSSLPIYVRDKLPDSLRFPIRSAHTGPTACGTYHFTKASKFELTLTANNIQAANHM
jgi:hypothetical protein